MKISSLFLFSLLTIANLNPAQAAGIETYGIDHVGITVPNIEQTVRFFKEAFGCEPVTKIGPFPVSESLSNDRKTAVKARAESMKIVMIRCVNGSNIELFEYKKLNRS